MFYMTSVIRINKKNHGISNNLCIHLNYYNINYISNNNYNLNNTI